MIEFEASHGTVADLWHAHLRNEETSMNPLGMVEALLGAMNHSADLIEAPAATASPAIHGKAKSQADEVRRFTSTLRLALHNTFRYGQGTRDMAGPSGLTTEAFVDKVAWRLGRYMAALSEDAPPQPVFAPPRTFRRNCTTSCLHLAFIFPSSASL